MKIIKPFMLLLICALPFLSLTAKADDDHGNGHAYGHDKNPKEGKKVPIDGGITLLLAAGAAFGAKKIFSKSKNNTPDA